MRGEPMQSNISIKAGEEDLEFSGLALGPPSGVCSRHYARFCQKEGVHTTAHKVISLTTERVGGPELGGSLYDASFGVLVEQQTDTMILHNAAHFHGTTLHKRDPNVMTTDIVHAGFSLLVGRGLHERYAEYLASKASILLSAATSRVEQLCVDTAMPAAPPMQEDVAMIHKTAESVRHGGKQT